MRSGTGSRTIVRSWSSCGRSDGGALKRPHERRRRRDQGCRFGQARLQCLPAHGRIPGEARTRPIPVWCISCRRRTRAAYSRAVQPPRRAHQGPREGGGGSCTTRVNSAPSRRRRVRPPSPRTASAPPSWPAASLCPTTSVRCWAEVWDALCAIPPEDKLGAAGAQMLGEMFLAGKGVPQNDRSAGAGVAPALHTIATPRSLRVSRSVRRVQDELCACTRLQRTPRTVGQRSLSGRLVRSGALLFLSRSMALTVRAHPR